MNDVMRDMLSLGTISVRELSEARVHVLDLVVRLACTNARQADLDALEANVVRTERATREGRLLDRVECSREFYRLLAAATGNKVIAMIVDSVTRSICASSMPRSRRAASQWRGWRKSDGNSSRRWLSENMAMATRLMRVHLESVQRMLEQDPGAMSLHVALAEVQPGMRR